jgi:hypothetical protein
MDALPDVRVVQSLDAGQASAGLWVQYSSEEADSSLWGCTAGPDLAQQRVLHSSLIHFCCCDSIDLQHKTQHGHTETSDVQCAKHACVSKAQSLIENLLLPYILNINVQQGIAVGLAGYSLSCWHTKFEHNTPWIGTKI